MRKGRWFLLVLILVVGGAAPGSAQQSSSNSDADSARLPVKRVVLYKNGVGYFEHSARGVHASRSPRKANLQPGVC
jgi:hypothetical protein